MDFGTARGIDLIWDVIVGQGGRFLHAYLFARFVASDVLVWTMERSAVPYHYYAALSFSTVSWPTLWSIVRVCAKKRGLRTIFGAVALFWTVAYLIAFPTIWSAATGYVNPSRRVYGMPDGSFISLDSTDLALCYSIQDERMGWTKPHVEIGPTLVDIDSYFSSSSMPVLSIPGQKDKYGEYLPLIGRDDLNTWDTFKPPEGFRNLALCWYHHL